MYRFFIITFLVFIGCSDGDTTGEAEEKPLLFEKLSASETGIDFQNRLVTTQDFDVFRYRNFYNGGGVGIGDFNNDGLSDVFLTSNMGDNKLYLNKGNWKFEDITAKARVSGAKIWSTGVSIADINHDGLLDIYVCNAGDVDGLNRENELFINNGDLTFTESASSVGLADKGFSTHAAFFDFDKDGDLDCYVLNNSYRPVASLGYRNIRHVRDEFGGHKLYRNDEGFYKDISEEAGIYGSVIGFGLGVTVGDVNQDNWPDLYISNDFYERDYLYINKQDGTFAEMLEGYMEHISMFSMGADLADINNDGFPDIFSTDMLPADDYRLKTLTSFETYDVYQLRVKNGYYHQYMRNMLHLNNRDGTFSEIGQMAQVDATDWSWGALIADFDNDQHKEIFVCNGIYKDVTNQDFVEYLGSSEQMRAAIEGRRVDFADFVERMPSVKLSNFMFKLNEDLRYDNVAAAWGLDEPSFSNGAAYGDLDNDGDLDLIVNNVNQELFVYRNRSSEASDRHFLSISFKGAGKNTFGLGASVKAFIDDQIIAVDHMPIRGFQSSMDYKTVIGLGNHNVIDSLVVQWPDGKIHALLSVRADQHLVMDYKALTMGTVTRAYRRPAKLMTEIDIGNIVHVENEYNDFNRDRLLYHMVSTQGPAFSVSDINSDGLDDFYVGGSIGSFGRIFIKKGEKYTELKNVDVNVELFADDSDAAFFDADADGDQDLYVVSGGSENLAQTTALADRFYENTGIKNGVPVFENASQKIPAIYQSGSCVRPADVDRDGDIDLFVGTRLIPSYYGLPADQFLLLNDGKGNFTDASQAWASGFRQLGMVTDAAWFDYDGNAFPDLIIVGEWMPITIFANDGKTLKKVDLNASGLSKSAGLWNRIKAADIDLDGDIDFVLGNLGLNSKFHPSEDSPLSLYVNDFDNNGSMEPVFAFEKDGVQYPFALRQDLVKQMSSLKKKFLYYKDYAGKSLSEILEPKILTKTPGLTIYQSSTSILRNKGDQSFSLKALPWEAQVSPVYGIAIEDVNRDSIPDIVLGGNLYAVKPEVGRYDALQGLVLKGDGKGSFKALSSLESGFQLKGEVRHISVLHDRGRRYLAVARNNHSLKLYEIR